MGTNYYWYIENLPQLSTGELLPIDHDHPSIHIGLSYSGSHGNNFILAQPLEVIEKACKKVFDDHAVINEYGSSFSGKEFLSFLNNIYVFDTHSIGKIFS